MPPTYQSHHAHARGHIWFVLRACRLRDRFVNEIWISWAKVPHISWTSTIFDTMWQMQKCKKQESLLFPYWSLKFGFEFRTAVGGQLLKKTKGAGRLAGWAQAHHISHLHGFPCIVLYFVYNLMYFVYNPILSIWFPYFAVFFAVFVALVFAVNGEGTR